MEEKKIKCSSMSTNKGKYDVVKAWLKLNNVDFKEREHSVGSHYWKRSEYNLSAEQLYQLLDYLREADVNDCMVDVIV